MRQTGIPACFLAAHYPHAHKFSRLKARWAHRQEMPVFRLRRSGALLRMLETKGEQTLITFINPFASQRANSLLVSAR